MPTGDLKYLASNVARLSALLTKDRESLPAAYLKDPGLRAAYLRYFMPSNTRKIHLPLAELSLHSGLFLSKQRVRVLDLGAGPGTALLGLFSFFEERAPGVSFSCVAVDTVAENLGSAEEIITEYKNRSSLDISIKTLRTDIENVEELSGRFDLIIFSNVLNELFPFQKNRIARRSSLVRSMIERFLGEKGICIIIEPALRTITRELLELRNMLSRQGFTIYAPCLTADDCPALINPSDWCHEDIPWDPPLLIKEIDAVTGLRKDSIKFSYVVLTKDDRSLAGLYGSNSFRVVSEALVSKGKIEFFVCGAGGRKRIVRLDKDKTEENALFELLRRGAIAGFDGLIDEGTRFKIKQSTKVIIKRNTI